MRSPPLERIAMYPAPADHGGLPRRGPPSVSTHWSGGGHKFGQTLPWKTVKEVITASITARFAELDPTSGDWPCDYPTAQSIRLKVASGPSGGSNVRGIGPVTPSACLIANAELEPSEIQHLAEIIPSLLALKAKFAAPLTFRIQIELGDGKERPSEEAAKEINKLLKELKDGFELQ